MNILAVDIGNTAIKLALFIDDAEKTMRRFALAEADIDAQVKAFLTDCWRDVPLVKSAKSPVKDAVIVVSSVNPPWTERFGALCRDALNEPIKVIGKDVPLPIETSVDAPFEVGTDRLVAAAAAFSVVEDAVVVADFGTAVTIDLVDETGVFVGGTISPGMQMSLDALRDRTAKLPAATMQKPAGAYGANTIDAMRAGVYWAAVGLLETVCRKYAEQLGRWPHVILTGGAAALFKDDCEFVDSYVPDLSLRGIVIAYKKALYEAEDIQRLDDGQSLAD